MRTTFELPDELYRTLKTRAAISGVTMRELVQRLIEQGLREPAVAPTSRERPDPPVIVPATGRPISINPDDFRHLEEADDLERHDRSTGHERLGRPERR